MEDESRVKFVVAAVNQILEEGVDGEVAIAIAKAKVVEDEDHRWAGMHPH